MRRMTTLLINTVIQKKGPNNRVRFNLEDTAPTSKSSSLLPPNK